MLMLSAMAEVGGEGAVTTVNGQPTAVAAAAAAPGPRAGTAAAIAAEPSLSPSDDARAAAAAAAARTSDRLAASYQAHAAAAAAASCDSAAVTGRVGSGGVSSSSSCSSGGSGSGSGSSSPLSFRPQSHDHAPKQRPLFAPKVQIRVKLACANCKASKTKCDDERSVRSGQPFRGLAPRLPPRAITRIKSL